MIEIPISDEVRERFSQYVLPEPNSGCWLWTGGLYRSGYGQFSIARCRPRPAHRVSWALHHGCQPPIFVCHHCDVRLCVNPDHLFLGDHADNMQDMVDKGRHRTNPQRGESNINSKLTEADIRAIRSDIRGDRAVARDYGVRHSLIWAIKQGKTWKHVL
jgi:hypothetical protein